ncbi:MAG: cardiolipin synthase B [Verrucomicrobiaceae bacterium]|nr:MAG: cardiolipin synthase B [Verrucomicrobiaceae bacterium]
MLRLTILTVFVAALLALSGCVTRDKELRGPIAPRSNVAGPEFRQAVGNLLGAPLVAGNRITTLQNGDEVFPAMLTAIRNARKTITFEAYVFEDGNISLQFAEVLMERARAGVKVHMILDAHGASESRPLHQMLREAGVELALFHPLRPWDLRRYNNRTHRKLMVIDGRLGFIGGVGIAEEWEGHAQSPSHWRDNHYRVEGPAVAQMQAAFADNWIKVHSELLHGPDYFPELPPRGNTLASIFYSSPRRGRIHLEVLYHLAISSARKSLLIENAYFVPDSKMVNALAAAARRGVRIQILVPGEHTDYRTVQRAGRRRYGPLLEAGVEIYEYQPTMMHSKLLIVDGLFTTVGSANFDYRSIRLNDEANLNVYDRAFAAEQTRIFERDRALSRRYTEKEHRWRLPQRTVIGIIEEPVANLL